jgi:GNAT superfamily N-acetyltransferase
LAVRSALLDREKALVRTSTLVAGALANPRPSDYMAIAEHAGKPRGFVYAVTREDSLMEQSYAFVLEVVFDEDGHGVGRALLEAVEAWAGERGLPRIN